MEKIAGPALSAVAENTGRISWRDCDLSGPAFRTGFESYLTGYPLKTFGLYCFARTWFALELPRPGCVWTHTLIIKNEDGAEPRLRHRRTSFLAVVE